MNEASASSRRVWIYPLVLMGGVSVAWIGLLLAFDYFFTFDVTLARFWTELTGYTPSDMQGALGNLPEVVVAILGIATTVVSIILQLSATRYTPRVTTMFFVDRTNLLVIGFYVVASIHCIWATVTVHSAFIPHITVVTTLLMMTAAILLLIPYFAYVFAFLDPERIVAHIQAQTLTEALRRGEGGDVSGRQQEVLRGIEQLADIAVNAVEQKDRVIASRTVDALRDLVMAYGAAKAGLSPRWFELGERLRRNPDFVAMAPQRVAELSRAGTWVEWKVLRQYQTLCSESLTRLRDINQLVAIDTRYVGEQASAWGDAAVLSLVIKFFNTYLRATINGRDVRSAYNVLHQYRLLGEALIRGGRDPEVVVDLAHHFKYYGLIANSAGLAFINETAAYDLCALCEVAHGAAFPEHEQLLDILLEVDKQPETEAQEQSLRGVRKAQVKLATFYLHQGEQGLARRIWRDMEHERPERLRSIREEMMAVEDEDFWEVVDRGYNFDYLPPERRKELDRFYAWFTSL